MKAAISVEWIGKNTDDFQRWLGEKPLRMPWCARVDLKARGFDRSFLSKKVDYIHANSKGSRGVFVWFVLESGFVYEIKRNTSWHNSERIFVRVLLDGSIQEGSKEDAERWLSDPLE